MRQIILLVVVVVFIFPSQSFSQDAAPGRKSLPDSLINNIVNDFLIAVNSGDREIMQEFILMHYDPNSFEKIPLGTWVTLNMGFYYETGGLGYRLLEVLPPEINLISAELYNKLTGVKLKFRIPLSAFPSHKITWFIEHEPSPTETDGQHIKPLIDDEIKIRVEQSLKKLEEDDGFSGSVLIAKNGIALLKKAIGMANKSYEIPVASDTKFNIASVGKIFTGLAITQLAEQGQLSFDDPISKYVPAEWLAPQISKKIQIKHLLTHTSGLGDYFGDAYSQWDVPYFRNLEDYKFLVVDDTTRFEPGARFSYSNTGFLLLGVIIENITQKKYFHYLKENIFDPVGMINTDGFAKDRPVKNRATGYTKGYDNVKVYWDNHQFTRIMKGSPSGGIYSTVEDLLKFDRALRANKLLSPEYSEIFLKGRPDLNAFFHSYGFFVSDGPAGREASHGGDGRGINCRFKMFLDSGYTIIVLSNYSPPSANIVGNVIDQLITYRAVKN